MSTNKSKKQWFWVILVVAIGLVLSALLFFTGKNKASGDTAAAADSHGEGEEGHTEGEAGQAQESEEGSLNLSPKQMTEYGVKLAQVGGAKSDSNSRILPSWSPIPISKRMFQRPLLDVWKVSMRYSVNKSRKGKC